jgi:alpha-amylase
MQADALRALYALEKPVLDSKDQNVINDWRKLQTSDHFYYMCTKWSADGDVHAYFSPYDSPLEAYRRYSVVLADLEERLL